MYTSWTAALIHNSPSRGWLWMAGPRSTLLELARNPTKSTSIMYPFRTGLIPHSIFQPSEVAKNGSNWCRSWALQHEARLALPWWKLQMRWQNCLGCSQPWSNLVLHCAWDQFKIGHAQLEGSMTQHCTWNWKQIRVLLFLTLLSHENLGPAIFVIIVHIGEVWVPAFGFWDLHCFPVLILHLQSIRHAPSRRPGVELPPSVSKTS